MRIVDAKLTKNQLDKISDFCISLSQVFFASVFIGPIISGNYDMTKMLAGLFFTISSLFFSILIIKN